MQLLAVENIVLIALLWVILFWFYVDYSIDAFRQRMFELRDALFDQARKGEISFESQAYSVLREKMNGFIRFAHRFSLIQLIGFVFMFRNVPDHTFEDQDWDDALSALSEQQRKLINQYEARMHLLVIEKILFGSPVVLITVVLRLTAYIYLRSFSAAVLERLRDPLIGLDTAALRYSG